jgi:hypothetical protein
MSAISLSILSPVLRTIIARDALIVNPLSAEMPMRG